MKTGIFIFSLLLATIYVNADDLVDPNHIVDVNDIVDARTMFENSTQKLSLKNVLLGINLETFDKKGNSKSKTLRISFAEFDQQKKVMVEITAPVSVSGIKILSTDYLDKKGTIEIYMPSTGKIQKMRASQNKMKILGSEIPLNQFSTEIDTDLNFTAIGKEVLNKQECYKIKVQKTDEKTYGIAYISVVGEYLLRIEKYDRQDRLEGMTELSDYVKIDNSTRKVYPREIHVKNYKTGSSSTMRVHSINYNRYVDIADFILSPVAL